MKRILAVFALASAAALLRADDASDLEEKARRFKALVSDLDSDRTEVREDAATRLLASGADAIPFVLDGVYRKNAKLHLQVLEKLVAQERKGLPAELQMSDADLKGIVKDRLGDPKVTQGGETFLYAKYLEAVDLYRQNRYEQSLAKASAILELDSRVKFAGDVKLLKIKCEEQLVQLNLVKLSATTMTPVVADNTVVKVAFSATNMAAGDVEIWFGPSTDQGNPDVRKAVIENQALLQVEIVTTTCEPDGSSSSSTESSMKPLQRYSIPVRRGDSAKLFEMELPAMTGGVKLVRLFVNARMRVFAVDGPVPMQKERWLTFQPVEIRVVPGNIQEAAQNALQKLCDSIDNRQPDSTFLFCNVMPDKDRPLAVEALMRILREPKYSEYDRRVARNCLQTLTGEALADDKAWIRWYEEKSKAPPPGGDGKR